MAKRLAWLYQLPNQEFRTPTNLKDPGLGGGRNSWFGSWRVTVADFSIEVRIRRNGKLLPEKDSKLLRGEHDDLEYSSWPRKQPGNARKSIFLGRHQLADGP
jgi:hypothetical protein